MGPGLRDVVCNPPPYSPYDALKEAIINRFSMTKDNRLKQLLNGIRLGDNGLHTPTQLLSYMGSLDSSLHVSENVLRICWMQALPEYVASFLRVFANKATLDELAEAADSICAHTPSAPPVTRLSPDSRNYSWKDANDQVNRRLDEIMTQVAALKFPAIDRVLS
ncbi:unnamed protein product, partial [Echinostoma caproni]|uniref:Site-specific DNA-methyltransferase (adenine-specific) n=1 Tax=Echinostoma caproni TaxID=27848 RepID=A0A183A3E0_9TREM